MALGDFTKTVYNDLAVPIISAGTLNNNEDKTKELDTQVAINTPAIATLQTTQPNKNLFDNGGDDIWQNGTSFTFTEGYVSDQWYMNAVGDTPTFSRSTSVPNNRVNFSIDVATTTATSLVRKQRMTGYMATQLVDREVTISAWLFINDVTDVSITLIEGVPTALDDWTAQVGVGGPITVSLSNGWNFIKVTHTTPDGIFGEPLTQGYEIGLAILSSGASNNYNFAQFKLEYGNTATDFIPNTFADEKFASDVYFQGLEVLSELTGCDTDQIRIPVQLNREMRILEGQLILKTALYAHGITAGSTPIATIWDGTGSPPTIQLATNKGTRAESETLAITLSQGLYLLNGSPTAAQWVAAGYELDIDARLT